MKPSQRYRASKATILVPNRADIVAYNFLTHATVECSKAILTWLDDFSDWSSVGDVCERYQGTTPQDLIPLVKQLEELGLLVREGSKAAATELELEERWEWGLPAAMLHFSTLNNDFLSMEEGVADTIERISAKPQPPMHLDIQGKRVLAPPSHASRVSGLLNLLQQRRSNRTPDQKRQLTVGDISDCLYAGLGIVGYIRTPSGDLPLKPTPSGGARNPYDAFVIAQECGGIECGVYLYDGVDHSLTMVSSEVPSRLGELVGGQDWANDMPAMILLVASLERTMWKYSDSNAYRVVLIEAGHIGQNIMVAATGLGLTACPTAALAHSRVSEALHIEGMMRVPVYALTLSWPGASTDQYITNPAAGGSMREALCAA